VRFEHVGGCVRLQAVHAFGIARPKDVGSGESKRVIAKKIIEFLGKPGSRWRR
jgi:hypothetical protein